jgi:hypothetical protein
MGTVDFGRWDPPAEERGDVEHWARRLPNGWRVECGGSPSALPLLVLVKDSAGEEFDRRSYEFGDFAAVARLVERVVRELEAS